MFFCSFPGEFLAELIEFTLELLISARAGLIKILLLSRYYSTVVDKRSLLPQKLKSLEMPLILTVLLLLLLLLLSTTRLEFF